VTAHEVHKYFELLVILVFSRADGIMQIEESFSAGLRTRLLTSLIW